MMLVGYKIVHSGVIIPNSGEQQHLLHAVHTDRRTMSLPTGELSIQMLYQIKQASMYAFTTPGHCANHQICELLSENRPQRYSKGGNNLDLAEQDNRVFENGSEEAYQSTATVTALVGWNLAV